MTGPQPPTSSSGGRKVIKGPHGLKLHHKQSLHYSLRITVRRYSKILSRVPYLVKIINQNPSENLKFAAELGYS